MENPEERANREYVHKSLETHENDSERLAIISDEIKYLSDHGLWQAEEAIKAEKNRREGKG